MKSKTLLRLLGILFAFALVAAACGDAGEAQEPTEEPEQEADPEPSDPVAAGVAAAQAVMDELSVLPTSIGLTEPIVGDIPTGLRIVAIPINVPSAVELITFLQEAAAELGWTAESVSGGTTPEEFKAAFAQVCNDAPDAVFSLGIPSAVVTEELECLRDKGIPMVFQSTAPEGIQDSDLVLANIYDHTPQFISGTHNANWVIADSGGNANIVYYDFGAVETVHFVSLGFEETITENCPNCTFERIDVPAEDIGTNLPGQIVSYMRANPDTNYIALAFSDLAIGVPGALSDAGIGTDEVRLIGANPGPGNRVNIAAGNYEQAAISFPKFESQWRVIDIFARHFSGNDVSHPQDAAYPYFMYSSDNVDNWGGAAEDEWSIVPDYKEQYLALWFGDPEPSDPVAAGVAAAQAVMDELSVLPTSIGLTEPIVGDIPTGLRIVAIPINVPSAVELITFLQEAAAELGWTAESVSGGTTPEEFKAAFAQVCNDAPDAVFSLGIPSAVVTEELECLRDKGIPMVFQSTAPEGIQDSDLVLANIYDHTPQFISGTHNANWVIADSGGNANIVYYDFGAVETVHFVSLGFEETITENCPNCTFERIDVPAEDIGTNLPGQIVSYMRANPDTNYIALAFSDLAIGVPGALSDAGIGTDEVRLIGANPGPGNRVNIAAGNYEQAAISFPKFESQWRVIDIFARHFSGNDVSHPQDAAYPYFMYSSDNVDNWGGAAEDEWSIVPDYKEQYLALWFG